MNLKRIVFLSICMIVSIGTYSQSKLINAGKAGKVSGTVKTETNKPKSNTSPKPKTVVKQSDDKYKSVGYMEISGISFANGDDAGNLFDDYGSDLYAGDVKYLMAKVFYKGLASSQKEITLYYKIIKEDGSLMTGKNSPEGYTYSSKVKVESGVGKSLFLTGYGNNYATAYTSGQYKYEIWYNGNVLFQKGFRIHSGKTPLVNSKLMKISNVSFGNADKKANLISGYGETLYENEVQYLQPQISYQGHVLSEQTATLMIRIVLPGGNMTKGSSSPLCFTTKDDVEIKPGYNTSVLVGWGNDKGTLYKSGTYRYEIWLNGDKIYETIFEVKKRDQFSTALSGTSSIAQFFPLCGVTLGKTTWKEAEEMGYNVEIWNDGPSRTMYVNKIHFWDHGGKGKFTQIYWTQRADFPTSWKSKGFSWDNSYDKWLETFKNLGFTIKVTSEPVTKIFSGRQTLSADVVALSADGLLEFRMDFDYGEDGYYKSSPKTLYTLTIQFKGSKIGD